MSEIEKVSHYTSLRLKKSTRDKIKWISQSLNQSQIDFVEEFTNELFELFSSFNPKNKDANIMYSGYAQKLIITSNARKNYLSSGCISGVNPNISEAEEDSLVKNALECE